MGREWNVFGYRLCKVMYAFLLMYFHTNGCLSLNFEGLALLEFRSRVDIDPHGALENWDARDSDPCNWTGVYCVNGVVEMLNLKELSLGGTLAPELGRLCHLRSIVLYKNNFFGAIPKEIGSLNMLELLDLRNNNLSGAVPTEIREMLSLKHLLLRGNKLPSHSPSSIEGLDMLSDRRDDRNVIFDKAIQIAFIKRKLYNWFKFKSCSSSARWEGNSENLLGLTSSVQNRNALNSLRRRLFEETRNLAAVTPVSSYNPPAAAVPSIGSGSFPAIPNSKIGSQKKQPPMPTAPEDPPANSAKPGSGPIDQTNSVHHDSLSRRLAERPYIFILPAVALLLILSAVLILMCRKKEAPTIGPWRTGLSGQLKKAFITGVPKLNREELVAACEDFSNIISSSAYHTVFKGTLSSGVEIAVVSTAIKSAQDWSKHSETSFRKKIDMLSRINHKNFINLLGYCEENEPFTRMMVFEYAPNGTLFEHLHVKEFEYLDWSARMRIIMGITYCLQYLHHELSPPIVHLVPKSTSIFITDDYAAKVADTSVWKDIKLKGTTTDSSSADPRQSVYGVGILLLEIISGKIPYSDEQGSLADWAMKRMTDKSSIVDPSLKSHSEDELSMICEVIRDCIDQDTVKTQRPTMLMITSKLRNIISITPEAATPRLSPLWWAELEILSVQAS
ncbi:LOW QUALITY PROTEIN: protein MALE DISCOVERER 2-like [Dioscorea cayenensis subsp. rotundata]|uniref:LOW QUALITY PROTEIN: protein MALE DISCOVERER 2-like n=1 Tax=Dioscorea cayennensis subsp. rotundata TaxID=55577 RepID=A0AB40AT53_DIOCR|nr:LOW QUALITY PROTEIN: protein MALE DISCOVERER 2-like [Dioscorea cayenensis subsp. rotundata]